MTKDDVKTKLREGNILIEFVKVGGGMRTMTATLNSSQIVYAQSESTNNRKPNNDVCSVWDVRENAWKSFRWTNLRFVDELWLPYGISE